MLTHQQIQDFLKHWMLLQSAKVMIEYKKLAHGAKKNVTLYSVSIKIM